MELHRDKKEVHLVVMVMLNLAMEHRILTKYWVEVQQINTNQHRQINMILQICMNQVSTSMILQNRSMIPLIASMKQIIWVQVANNQAQQNMKVV